MSWVPTTPEVKTVFGPPISKSIDRFKVAAIEILTDQAVLMTVCEGYDDAGTFVEVSRYQVEASGEPLSGVMLELADGTKTIRDVVRDAAYQLLLDLGKLPEGNSE